MEESQPWSRAFEALLEQEDTQRALALGLPARGRGLTLHLDPPELHGVLNNLVTIGQGCAVLRRRGCGHSESGGQCSCNAKNRTDGDHERAALAVFGSVRLGHPFLSLPPRRWATDEYGTGEMA